MITEQQLDELASDLFHAGAIKFGEFKIKLHERNPDAPLSPIYLSLGPKREGYRGMIDEALLERICYLLSELLRTNGVEYDHVCGIPQAAEAYAEWLSKPPLGGPHLKGHIRLRKETKPDGTLEITGIESSTFPLIAEEQALLVDDLITAADSKHEAIRQLEKKSLVVKHLVVVLDRCQGGVAFLKGFGYTTHALFTLPDLLERLRRQDLLDELTHRRVLKYLENNAAP